MTTTLLSALALNLGMTGGSPSAATTYTIDPEPASVAAGGAVVVTVAPDGTYSGAITLTPGGSASTGLAAQTLNFAGPSTPQSATFTPTTAGTLTFTGSNGGGLANPFPAGVTVTSSAGGSGFTGDQVAALMAMVADWQTMVEPFPGDTSRKRFTLAALSTMALAHPVSATPAPTALAVGILVPTGKAVANEYLRRRAYRAVSSGEAVISGHTIAAVNLGGSGYDVHLLAFPQSAPLSSVPEVGELIAISA
jgi:hypothetical protein